MFANLEPYWILPVCLELESAMSVCVEGPFCLSTAGCRPSHEGIS